MLLLPPHVLTYSTYIWNKQTQINLKIYWLLTEVLTKMENREIVMLGISIETKELCCRNSKDCLLYRIVFKIYASILSTQRFLLFLKGHLMIVSYRQRLLVTFPDLFLALVYWTCHSMRKRIFIQLQYAHQYCFFAFPKKTFWWGALMRP